MNIPLFSSTQKAFSHSWFQGKGLFPERVVHLSHRFKRLPSPLNRQSLQTREQRLLRPLLLRLRVAPATAPEDVAKFKHRDVIAEAAKLAKKNLPSSPGRTGLA